MVLKKLVILLNLFNLIEKQTFHLRFSLSLFLFSHKGKEF
jgi:hypothetical protein